MQLSVESGEWQQNGQMQAFYQLCEEVGLSPDDVDRPTQRPRASDRAQDFRFAKKCHRVTYFRRFHHTQYAATRLGAAQL